MKKKLEHTDSFDTSIYKEMGTTTVRECHTYTDNIDNDRLCETEFDVLICAIEK